MSVCLLSQVQSEGKDPHCLASLQLGFKYTFVLSTLICSLIVCPLSRLKLRNPMILFFLAGFSAFSASAGT